MDLEKLRRRGYRLPYGYMYTSAVEGTADISDENVIACVGEPLSIYRWGWVLVDVEQWVLVTDYYSRLQIDSGVVQADLVVCCLRDHLMKASTRPVRKDELSAMLDFFGTPAGQWPGFLSSDEDTKDD